MGNGLDDRGGSYPHRGRTYGSSEVVRRIGVGTTSIVCEARNVRTWRSVALKVPHPHLANHPDVFQRFSHEAQTTGVIAHSNVREIFDLGQADDGTVFAVCELLTGHDLADDLQAGGPLAIGRAVRIAGQLASALGAAHALGIVHGALRPEKVFLTEPDIGGDRDFVKAFGFGCGPPVARGRRNGTFLVTPHYMPPEQLYDPRRIDARADVHALGCVLYEMLAGRVPYDGDTIPHVIQRILNEAPVPLTSIRPDVPPALASVIDRAMSKEVGRRTASAAELRDGLAPFAGIMDRPRLADA